MSRSQCVRRLASVMQNGRMKTRIPAAALTINATLRNTERIGRKREATVCNVTTVKTALPLVN